VFTPHFRGCFDPISPGRAQPAAGSRSDVRAGEVLCRTVFLGILALALPQASYAQALGTMQVTARVVPAPVAWTGLAEAGEAARSAVRDPSAMPVVRRGRLLQARAEIRDSACSGLLIVTVQHLRN
jgi:hypothetical protein